MSRDFIKKTRDWLLDIQTEVFNDLVKLPVHRAYRSLFYHAFMQTLRTFMATETVHGIDLYNKDGLYIQLV